MKKLLLSLAFGLCLSPILASDIITDAPAQELFRSLFDRGGDIYCTANQCRLIGHCIFDRTNTGSSHYKCEINNDVNLDVFTSESLFRDIFDATLTMDGKCSANYCELSTICTYSRLDAIDSHYSCEIF